MELFQSMVKQKRFTMLLAPFQPTIRIELETFLSTTVECYLDVKNPSDKTLNVTITKVPDAKRQITLNMDKLEIPGQSSCTIIIKWSPIEAGCWRDILQLTDGRKIKYDITIATTAKVMKRKTEKSLPKKTSSKLPAFSALTVNKRLHQDNMLLNVPNNICQLNIKKQQMRGDETKRERSSNKENTLSKYHEVKIHTSQENDRSVRPQHGHHEPTNVLSEQHSNVWSDGSVLPQIMLISSAPQEIRRATYVKEKGHYNGIATIYECNEETTKDIFADRRESNFSMLINELKFNTTNIVAASPRPVQKEFTSSLNVKGTPDERNKTFAVDHRTFEVSTISEIPEFSSSIVMSPVTRPLEYFESSFKDGANNLIASSPIPQRLPNEVPSTERSGCFVDSIDCSRRVEYFSCTTVPETAIQTAKKAQDVYIEISPPKKYQLKSYSPLFSAKTGRVTKEKNLCNGRSAKGHQLFIPVTARKNTKKNVALKINKSTLRTLRAEHAMKKCGETRPQVEKISIYEEFTPSPFTSSMTQNPFLKNVASTFNEKWLSRQESVFTLWLNTVLSTPTDLRVNIDNMVTDTIKKWESRKNYDEGIDVNAPHATYGIVSSSHHTARKLYALRENAYAMFRRVQITNMKTRIDRCVAEGMLYIRSDRDLHRDISLQKDVLNIFLCYNPLWLRIGLEVVYNEEISLRNNNDLFGFTRFLTERFFTNPQLTKVPGYHRANPNKKFLKALNQFILKKFLLLVYFLDYAKKHKLIAHDPCLFHKRAEWKTSRDILLRFSRDLLAEIGDVTKILRTYDYVLTHQQTYIDEYEYQVADIRQDLRDGVRLCRVVELITGVNGLTGQCRAPAISRLQKVHNMEVALSALRQVGGVLADDVQAKHIVDGNRTKTLSLLWQVVHKIEAPRFDQAACAIQRWWRSRVWYVRLRNYVYARKDQAAIVIQRVWRLRQRKTAVTEERVNLLRAREAATYLQRWWRLMRKSAYMKKCRELEDKRRKAVLVLQKRWRATLLMRTQKKRYGDLRNAALTIQIRWRRKRTMELRRAELLRIREDAAVRIQCWWRSIRLTREKREWFLRCRRSALLIQRTWKVYYAREQERRDACLRIQTWWRAASCSRRYQLQRFSCVKLQRWWRQRQRYVTQWRAVSLIESWYLYVKAGRVARENYLRMRGAAIRMQTWWRIVSLARQERARYQQLRQSVIILQIQWRRCVLARQDRQQFLAKKMACVILQSYWRMIRIRRYYERCRNCTITLQRRWRAIQAGRLVRRQYEDTRRCVILVQTRWRTFVARRRFFSCRRAAIVLQSHYRRWIVRKEFLTKKTAYVTLQSYWRMIRVRRYYQRCRSCAIMLQRRWRAIRAGRLVRKEYKDIQRGARKIEAELLTQPEDLALIVMDIQNKCADDRSSQEAVGSSILPSSDYWRQCIDTLRICNSVGAVLTYLNSLDAITKLSPTIRVTLCQLNLVDEIYKTLGQRNRSQPWMVICQRACSILITLAKCPYTKKYIVKQEHALLLVKLMSDALKDKEVFLHCATLIWLLSQDDNYLKAMVTSFDISWLLKNIQQRVSKATTIVKFQKSQKSSTNCESNQGSTLQFTDINVAVLAIINRTNIFTNL